MYGIKVTGFRLRNAIILIAVFTIHSFIYLLHVSEITLQTTDPLFFYIN
jgi:hypothetical protein